MKWTGDDMSGEEQSRENSKGDRKEKGEGGLMEEQKLQCNSSKRAFAVCLIYNTIIKMCMQCF